VMRLAEDVLWDTVQASRGSAERRTGAALPGTPVEHLRRPTLAGADRGARPRPAALPVRRARRPRA
jgi:hypothetical protein